MSLDPVANMLTIIRNGQMARLTEVSVPFSTFKKAIAELLKKEGYITDFTVKGEGVKQLIIVALKYFDGDRVIETIKRVSRPGLRVYKSCKDLPRVKNGLGVALVSTSKGLMSDRQARAAGLGGEVLCQIT